MSIEKGIGKPAVLEQLAEECAELGQAALKLARVIRKENPTPVTDAECWASLQEEIADVRACLNVLELDTVEAEHEKLVRWKNRIAEASFCDTCEERKMS